MWRFCKTRSIKEIAEYLQSLGATYFEAFCDMMIFDALIYNTDRHLNNFGLMVDNRVNQPYAMGPIFDNGLSLFNFAMADDFEDLETYAQSRLSAFDVSFDEIAREFITPRQKGQLRHLQEFKSKLGIVFDHMDSVEAATRLCGKLLPEQKAETAAGREGLQVGLDAGAATGVAPRNGQRAFVVFWGFVVHIFHVSRFQALSQNSHSMRVQRTKSSLIRRRVSSPAAAASSLQIAVACSAEAAKAGSA